jgi:hypothetical protein
MGFACEKGLHTFHKISPSERAHFFCAWHCGGGLKVFDCSTSRSKQFANLLS